VRDCPLAATILCQTLKLSEALPFAEALLVESFAYSTLLGGGEFSVWLAKRPKCATPGPEPAELVRMERDEDTVTLTLNNPPGRNAMTAAMRDALYTALANALDDPSIPRVVLKGAGKCFSTGGDLAEFGSARDLAVAHVARTLHANARMCHDLGDRLEVIFHGACIGSGLEVPAAAARRRAREGAYFQLPELRMGLIPGAGGTVSVARAIGRHRTAWMVLSGARITTARALEWGLIHQVLPQ
jgi:enoyl-CoA hydratase/carnithine racemase